jgi:hypothetical protein
MSIGFSVGVGVGVTLGDGVGDGVWVALGLGDGVELGVARTVVVGCAGAVPRALPDSPAGLRVVQAASANQTNATHTQVREGIWFNFIAMYL